MQTNVELRQRGALQGKVFPLVRTATLVVGGTLVIAVASKIYVPFYPVHMTLQTLAVMLLAATYGSRLALATVVAYLAEGALGVPVFTSTPPEIAGPLYFAGPTTGFLLGFLALAAVIGFAADRNWQRSIPKLLGATLLAECITFALGFAWLAWCMPLPTGSFGIGAVLAYNGGVAPFLLSETFKIGLVVLGMPAGHALMQRLSRP